VFGTLDSSYDATNNNNNNNNNNKLPYTVQRATEHLMTVMPDGQCAYEIVKKCGRTYASVGVTVSYIFKFVACISGEAVNFGVSL
jgi:hypothetical protein